MLSVGRMIDGIQRSEGDKLQEAFSKINIDWSEGVNHYEKAEEDLSVSLTFDDDILVAGKEETITIELENVSDRSYHQLSVVMLSDNPSLNHREAYFGVVSPQQNSAQTLVVTLPQGYGATEQEVTLQVRDPNKVLFETKRLVQHKPKLLPTFDWEVTVFDGQDGKAG